MTPGRMRTPKQNQVLNPVLTPVLTLPLERLLRRLGWGVLLMLGLLLSACGQKHSASTLVDVRFLPDGVALLLTGEPSAGSLDILTSDGKPIQSFPVSLEQAALTVGDTASGPRLLFPWRPETRYQFQWRPLQTEASASPGPLTLTAPARPPLKALLYLPYGQAETQLQPSTEPASLLSPATPGSQITLGLSLELTGDQPLTLQLDITGEGSAASLIQLHQTIELEPGTSSGAYSAPFLKTLTLPDVPGELPLTVRVKYWVKDDKAGTQPPLGELVAHAVLLTQDPRQLTSGLSVESHQFPANRRGEPELERLDDTVVLPNPLFQALARFFGANALHYDPYAPYAYQAVQFRNRLDYPLTVLLTASTVDERTGEMPEAFIPRAFEVTGGTGRITTLTRIPARGEAVAAVPFYVRPEVLDGTYLNRITVTLMGTSTELYQLERPLTVIRNRPGITGTLALAIPLSLAFVVGFALSYRRLMAGLGVRALSTIALFASLMFALSVVVDVLGVGMNALLGPFNILVGGLLYEVLHHLLLTPLLLLYPRFGTATLVGLTLYLMRGLTTGQLSPVDVLFVGSALALKELCLYALGVTRPRNDGPAHAQKLPPSRRMLVLQVGMALMLASGLTAVTSLALHSAFYRLYYADWYWWLNVGVAVVGPWPGVYWGVRLGESLNRVRD